MLTIRERLRRGYVREACGYIGWHEWQLVDGRKVIGRYDTKEQAEAARQALTLPKDPNAT